MSEVYVPGDRIVAVDDITVPEESLTISQRIGGGAFANVYAFERDGKQMAVKVFNEVVPLSGLGNRGREITALAVMNHPCVVQLLGVSLSEEEEEDSVWGICMNRCETSLQDAHLTDPTDKAIALIGIVMGMIHVHKAGFMHRDLKPGNVLVSHSDGRLAINIADFGSAREGDNKLTQFPPASWAFAPPQYWTGRAYTNKWDVFAFGAIWYWIVTGELLFSDKLSGEQWKQKLLEGRPAIPEDVKFVKLDSLMEHCWADEDNDRPSFREILDAMKERKYRIFKGADSAKVRAYVEAVEAEAARTSH